MDDELNVSVQLFLYCTGNIVKIICSGWRHPWRCSNGFWSEHPWKNKCIFFSRMPTRAELETCRHFDMMSHNEWNPDSVSIHDLRKNINYRKRKRGTSIIPNMILCKPNQSQHPTMSMIRIYIMNLLLTKPNYRKFPPFLYNWGSFVSHKSILQWQQLHKIEYDQQSCPSDVAIVLNECKTPKDSKGVLQSTNSLLIWNNYTPTLVVKYISIKLVLKHDIPSSMQKGTVYVKPYIILNMTLVHLNISPWMDFNLKSISIPSSSRIFADIILITMYLHRDFPMKTWQKALSEKSSVTYIK